MSQGVVCDKCGKVVDHKAKDGTIVIRCSLRPDGQERRWRVDFCRKCCKEFALSGFPGPWNENPIPEAPNE